MKWTTTPPSVPGNYHWSFGAYYRNCPVIVLISRDDSELTAYFESAHTPLSSPLFRNAQWSGPIPEPDSPEEENDAPVS